MSNQTDPVFWTETRGGRDLQVRCHFAPSDEREEVISETKRKARDAISNLDSIFKAVCRFCANSGIEGQPKLKSQALAMISAREPILYLSILQPDSELEVHVNLTDELDFGRAEIIEP